MVKGSTHGRMVPFMLENSGKASSMVKAGGRVRKGPNPAINTRATILTIKSMDTECSSGPVETLTKVNTRKMKEMAMEKCGGPMAAFIKVSGRAVYSMVMEK